ncbi:cysteine-rich CWC family protein [Ferroacidibacillus organovorans]|uniref:cysteine-rich CWC family protein n=1 Tax=Ferroacidibacillus organovorans TaxID=1765683 RepID=UPI001F39F0BC|nr:cysteine-rich CWC family protein [Ferroacidibacillus organovorans]
MLNGNKYPICGRDNNCGNVAGKPHGTCWCDQEFFPQEISDKIPSGSEKGVFVEPALKN